MSDKKYELLHREALFQGYFRVDRLHFRQQLYSGEWSEPFSREVFNGGARAAIVLPFDPHSDKVAMIEQFRPGPIDHGEDPFLIELVAGHIDPGESPEDAARRETLEEAGCKIQTLQKIFDYYPSSGCTSEHHMLYVGRTVAPADGEIHGLAEEGEDIKTVVLDAAKAINMLYMGKFRDASTIIAMQWFALHHTDLRSRWLISDASMPLI